MRRRPSRPASALDQSKDELARRESEVRDQMEKLERMIADAPRVAEEITRQQREELLMRASEGQRRLDVSISLQDKRYSDDGSGPRRGSLRKQRREGRIVFVVLIIALAGAIIWLISHLRQF